jgi:membrane protease YdiL (CAAX protease family)
MTQKSQLSVFKILAIFIVFLGIWGIIELLLYPFLSENLGKWTLEICCTAVKFVIWTLPAIFFIRHFDVAISWKEMLTSKIKWFDFSFILLIFAAYNLIGAFQLNGKLAGFPNFISLIGPVLFVGITEEVVFRGFFLNVFLKKMKKVSAILLTALLFLVIHFPIWCYNNVFLTNITSGAFLTIPILSIIFSIIFVKSKNIFVPIILHMTWNFMVTISFG